MRFELHCHTEVSHDGFTSLEGLLSECRRRGIDGVAITEHDEFRLTEAAIQRARSEGVFLIPAVEVTTDKGVHVIGLFVRGLPRSVPIGEIIAEIRRQGGLVSIPHPFKPKSGLLGNESSTEAEIFRTLSEAHFIETYNGGFDLSAYRAHILDLARQHRLTCIAASDCHKQWQVGTYLTEMDFAAPSDLAELRALMGSTPARLLKQEGFNHTVSKPSLVKRVRHSAPYQAFIARVPFALKRAVRVLRYRRAMRRYEPTLTVSYEELP